MVLFQEEINGSLVQSPLLLLGGNLLSPEKSLIENGASYIPDHFKGINKEAVGDFSIGDRVLVRPLTHMSSDRAPFANKWFVIDSIIEHRLHPNPIVLQGCSLCWSAAELQHGVVAVPTPEVP